MMTGDATNADPVCSKSPHHAQLQETVKNLVNLKEENVAPLVFRNMRNSKRIMAEES